MILCVVNRNKEEDISTDIIFQNGPFSGIFKVYEVNGPDIKSMNDFDSEKVITVEKPVIKANTNKISYSFPAHSFTMIKGKIKE